MRRAWLATGVLMLGWAVSVRGEDLAYYLPEGVQYDAAIPKPEAVLGWTVGEWHVRHDQLVEYMRAVAAASDRVQIEEIGRTHEERPLLLLTISSPSNLGRLEDIQRRHRALCNGSRGLPPIEDLPVVTWMGYSVHGNESSGSNAALLAVYHLAAAEGPEIESLLSGSVILVDPSLNPDGLSRFAQWANMHKGKQLVGNPASREHTEGWPAGRTNHYWFDLNRDWLLLQHPESRARVKQFHRWRPNVLTDHHEMGSGSTFFFQPGIPSRKNPNTPLKNVELTEKIGAYHAEILDQNGSLYYSEESFDDFYYGKGSTYPDVHGAVGILFEQASSRGHLQDTKNGPLTFPFTIKNQFLTTLSTLRAARDLRADLLSYQHEFYRTALEEATNDATQAYVFGEASDRGRTQRLVQLLLGHDIQVHRLGQRLTRGERVFEPGVAYIVPAKQPQYRLVKSVFERRTSFEDDAFYDVSAWTLPLAFGLPSPTILASEYRSSFLGERILDGSLPEGRRPPSEGANFYAFEWSEYFAPRALHRLMAAGLEVRAATEPFECDTDGGRRPFDRGAIIVAMGIQREKAAQVPALMDEIARRDGVDVYGIRSGLTPVGIDLGSPSLGEPAHPKPVLVVGGGTSPYAAGELWHLLDERFEMPVALVESNRLGRLDWSEVTHLILVSGSTGEIGGGVLDDLKAWVRGGGTVIATQGAGDWAGRELLPPASDSEKEKKKDEEEKKPQERIPYAEYRANQAKNLVSGAIFETRIDTTHPLGYGYPYDWLPVFRRGTSTWEISDDPYATVAQYVETPLLAGYCSAENQKEIAGKAAVIARRLGRGVVVQIADDPNFRAFWYGPNRVFLNALFFSPLIRSTSDTRTGE